MANEKGPACLPEKQGAYYHVNSLKESSSREIRNEWKEFIRDRGSMERSLFIQTRVSSNAILNISFLRRKFQDDDGVGDPEYFIPSPGNYR